MDQKWYKDKDEMKSARVVLSESAGVEHVPFPGQNMRGLAMYV